MCIRDSHHCATYITHGIVNFPGHIDRRVPAAVGEHYQHHRQTPGRPELCDLPDRFDPGRLDHGRGRSEDNSAQRQPGQQGEFGGGKQGLDTVSYTHLDVYKRQPINVNQLLREVLELDKQRLLAGGMIVDWKPTPILPAVTARVSRLRSMFKHLIDNALDAMEGLSLIHI